VRSGHKLSAGRTNHREAKSGETTFRFLASLFEIFRDSSVATSRLYEAVLRGTANAVP
jgi:hypothetical protein